MDVDPSLEMDEERAHFGKVLAGWDAYLQYELELNNDRRKALYSLPRAHQKLLGALQCTLPMPVLPTRTAPGHGGVRERIAEIDDRIRRNAHVLSQIAEFCRDFLGERVEVQETGTTKHVADADADRVRTVIRQLARDWSAQGKQERDAAYTPIVEALCARFPAVRKKVRLLVPGAGLARLAFDLAMLGFSVQANEFSYFMLIPSHFILNNSTRVHEHVVYPFVHSVSNWRSATEMLAPVEIPDVLPSTLPEDAEFSMAAGSFVEVYAKEKECAAWDAVATCYFMDTAKNVLRYMEVINHTLRLGGYWVNLGPLQWHFENDAAPSLELTLEELVPLFGMMGFELEERRTLLLGMPQGA
ncbi:hypothetical protein MVES_003460 [Malassezia vespertilionis]|uniref:carnosine N-methyltransferase n=1 Tax=Malassezia vespertilionis TaxID=2020962 RepID=A0A2N1J7X0_9BASI|nr:hypothetical protein MVES_003460 [Malassezia vespertilionis]